MAFVVEDGTALTNSTSLCSVADADTYLAVHFSSSTWTAASTSDKEAALQRATRFLVQEYAGKWKGIVVRETQALPWPRYEVYDAEGLYVDSEEIPEKIKNATAELALVALSEDLNPNVDNPSSIRREKSKLDVLEEDIEYFGAKKFRKQYTAAAMLVKEFLRNSNIVWRM